MTADREGFATRWSRKKRAQSVAHDSAGTAVSEALANADNSEFAHLRPVDEHAESSHRRGVVSEAVVPAEAPGADLPVSVSGDLSDEDADAVPVLTDADMPALDTLDGNSDVSGFFSKGVSSALRQAALRQIFSSPRYNVRDGLNDYDGDYTVFEPLGDTVTADMKYHAARKEAARLAALEEEKQLEAQQLAESSADEAESGDPDEQVCETEQDAAEDNSAEHDADRPIAEVDSSEVVAGSGTGESGDTAGNESLPT